MNGTVRCLGASRSQFTPPRLSSAIGFLVAFTLWKVSKNLTARCILSFTSAKKLAFKQESSVITANTLRRSPVAAKRPQEKAMATVSELALAECEVYYSNFGTNFAN